MSEEDHAQQDARLRRIHRPHPRCICCSRALYKTMDKGAPVRARDKFRFCRNGATCLLFGRDQSTTVRVGDVLLDLGTTDGTNALMALSQSWIAARKFELPTAAVVNLESNFTDPKGSLAVGFTPVDSNG